MRRAVTNRRPKHTWALDQMRSAAQSLQTDSGPTQAPLAAPISALRQMVQSSPYVQQLTSGQRTCNYTHLQLPRDLRLRIKPKLHPTTGRPQLTVDELEGHSRVATKSTYLPISARHLHQALNDPLCYRMASGIGAVRPDIVEHAGKVLQLRILLAMHRMHLQFSQHANPPAPLVIPEKGTTFGQSRSRLDVIRMEVDGRVQRQDARWQCMYPLVELPQSHSIDCVLPAAGLQCIVRLPPPLPYTRLAISDQPLSVSSEAMAKKVWKTLRKMHGNYEPIEYDVLAQIDWLAVQISGRPEPHNGPTLSMQALEQLYHWLPVLTPGLHVDGPVNHKGKRAKKLRAIDKQPENAWPRPFRSETQLAYQFSLAEPGLKYAHVDGARTKAVPVYDGERMFGREIASTVLPWLLAARVSGKTQQGDPDVPHRDIGVVALPCTADMAAQLHRLSMYAATEK